MISVSEYCDIFSLFLFFMGVPPGDLFNSDFLSEATLDGDLLSTWDVGVATLSFLTLRNLTFVISAIDIVIPLEGVETFVSIEVAVDRSLAPCSAFRFIAGLGITGLSLFKDWVAINNFWWSFFFNKLGKGGGRGTDGSWTGVEDISSDEITVLVKEFTDSGRFVEGTCELFFFNFLYSPFQSSNFSV